MNKLKLPAVIILMVILVSSCGKYDDGPFFSIYSKTERVTGFWRFDLVKEGGVDKTEDYLNQSLELYKNNAAIWVQGYRNNNPYDPILQGGTWKFTNDKENILMTFLTGTPSEYELNWKIKRLAYGDMRLERNDDVIGKIEWRLWKR